MEFKAASWESSAALRPRNCLAFIDSDYYYHYHRLFTPPAEGGLPAGGCPCPARM